MSRRAAAELDAINDNITHGLKRSNDDKRRAVERCLSLQPDWSHEKVAEWAGVTQQLVSDITSQRAALAATDTQTAEFTTVVNSDVSETPAGAKPKGKGRPADKEKGERVGKALKADPTKADDAVAAATKTTAKFVAKIRRALVKAGTIPAPPPKPRKPKGGGGSGAGDIALGGGGGEIAVDKTPPTDAERISDALVKDPAATDHAVASACGCKPALVARIRKRLVKEGVIPDARPPDPGSGFPWIRCPRAGGREQCLSESAAAIPAAAAHRRTAHDWHVFAAPLPPRGGAPRGPRGAGRVPGRPGPQRLAQPARDGRERRRTGR